MPGPTSIASGPPQHLHRSVRSLMGLIVAISGVIVPATVAGAASPGASPAPEGTSYTSPLGYSLVLPPGWSVDPSGSDFFVGPKGSASVGSGGPSEPGDTVEGRVANNRAGLVGCESDPGDDRPTTLGGEHAIRWTWSCSSLSFAAINTIHDGLRLRLQVNVPFGSDTEAIPLLERLREGFAFTSGASAPANAAADLATIDAEIQGTYETVSHPIELEFATVEAAGFAPEEFDPTTATTVKWAVKFEDGTIVQYEADDGGPFEIGWTGSYRLLDDHTIEAVESETGSRVVYEFTLRDGILTMDVVLDEFPDPTDIVVQTGILETLPFTKVP